MNDNQLQTLKSLWAELLLIDTARHPEYLIQCWHSDRHGCFSDARCRILTCALDGNRRICRFTEDGLRADSLLARELLQFHDVAAIPDIPALDKGSGILTLDITALDPIDTSSYDTSTSPLFRSAMMR